MESRDYRVHLRINPDRSASLAEVPDDRFLVELFEAIEVRAERPGPGVGQKWGPLPPTRAWVEALGMVLKVPGMIERMATGGAVVTFRPKLAD